MVKFKVGDKVKIKCNLLYTNRLTGLLPEMNMLASKKATITKVANKRTRYGSFQMVKLDIDSGYFWWQDDSFDVLDEDWD